MASMSEHPDTCGTPRYSFDMEDQRSLVAEERWRQHTQWCDKQSEATRYTLHNRLIALKILVNEAYQRDRETAQANAATDKELQTLETQWRRVGAAVVHDMAGEDRSMVVLKNLSCMCVFIREKVCREYGENAQDRQRRIERQHAVLCALHEKERLFKTPS